MSAAARCNARRALPERTPTARLRAAWHGVLSAQLRPLCHGLVRHRGPLTVEVMAEWARQDHHGSTDPRTWARRLKHLRPFARWLQQFEPRTEVPDDGVFGRLARRLAPHIYTERRSSTLLGAARRLGPSPGPRGAGLSRRCSA